LAAILDAVQVGLAFAVLILVALAAGRVLQMGPRMTPIRTLFALS
jgi:hypothetical protein